MGKRSFFQTLLLIGFGALGIAGILIFAFAVGGGNSNAIGQVTIWGTLDQNAFTVVLRQAVETNSSLSQVVYVQKDPTKFEQELTDALASGSGPDLFLMRQDYAYKDAGKVASIPLSVLSQSQFENAFVESASPFLTAEGVLGIPLATDPLVLYWNKDMLASAGFAQPPKTWGEIYAIANAITKKSDAGEIQKSGIAFGEYRNIQNAKDILSLLILQAGGTITAYDNSDHLVPALVPKTGSATRASEEALRYYTEFADPSKDYYTWNRSLREAQTAFAAGDVALYVGFASEEPTISRVNPNLNFAVAPIPQVASAQRSTTFARTYALAAPRAGKNPNSAITVAYLLGAADISKSLSIALGIPSARRDVLAQPAQGNDDLFNKMAIIGRSWSDPDPAATSDIFRAMIEDTTSGSALLSQAIQRADQQMAYLLGL